MVLDILERWEMRYENNLEMARVDPVVEWRP